MEFIRATFGYKKERLHVSYLGIPIRKGKVEKNGWFLLIDRIEGKLEEWKAMCMLFGGHLDIVLSAMPIYLMSVNI